MNDHLALRPDLSACTLEDRILPAIEFGLFPNPFLQVNAATNQIIVPGTSTSSAGINAGGSLNSNSISLQGLGSNPPGPQWYFLMVGGNASGVSSGSTVGGSLSLYTLTNLKSLPSGALVHTVSNLFSSSVGGGGGGGGGGGSGGSSGSSDSSSAGIPANVGGYGASFSSGYGFALSSGNNYGMFSGTGATTTLGSVPVHSYSGGGDISEAPELQEPTGGNSGAGTTPGQYGSPSTPPPVPGYGVQGPNSKLYQNLLGKSPGQMGPQPVAPATGMGAGVGQEMP